MTSVFLPADVYYRNMPYIFNLVNLDVASVIFHPEATAEKYVILQATDPHDLLFIKLKLE